MIRTQRGRLGAASGLLAPAAAGLMIAAAPAQAEVVYVDAVVDAGVGTPNTVATDGSPQASFYEPSGSSAALPGKWSRRAGFANNGDILQGLTSSVTNDIPPITTTISGLVPGALYDVYAFFWDADGNQAWSLDAGLDANALTTFQGPDNGSVPDTSSGAASGLTFSTAVLTAESNRTMLYGDLGQAVADGNGEIAVFVDNSTSVGGNAFRSWYDGVGYQIVPEPSSLALLGLGVTCALGRRRRA